LLATTVVLNDTMVIWSQKVWKTMFHFVLSNIKAIYAFITFSPT